MWYKQSRKSTCSGQFDVQLCVDACVCLTMTVWMGTCVIIPPEAA